MVVNRAGLRKLTETQPEQAEPAPSQKDQPKKTYKSASAKHRQNLLAHC
jgi:hypothetical protein